MKMRIKTLFALALAGSIMAGCAKDNLREGGETGTNVKADGGWMSLKISTPKTRAINPSADREIGTEDEMTARSLRVILFDGSYNVSDNFDVPILQTGSLITSDPFVILPDAVSILVIVNDNGMFDSFGPGYAFDNVNQAIGISSVGDVMGSGFMMTNAVGMPEPFSGGSIQDFTRATADAASRAPFTLNVDRVVSKVRLYMNAGPGELQFDPALAEWGLNVTNKLFYPVSERVTTYLGTPVWSDVYGQGSYRVDPNFDGLSPIYPSYEDNFFYEGSPSQPGNYQIDWKLATNAAINPDQPENPGGNTKDPVEYCLENTFDEANSLHAYTTQAVVRLNVYPPQVDMPEGGSMAVNAGEDWMLIAGARYSFESLMSWIEYYININIYTLAEAFNSYLVHIGAGEVYLYNDIATVMNDFRSRQSALQSHGGDAFGPVTYYGEGGMNYYKVMIKHDNDDSPSAINQLGEFGVVRNSVYDININSINTPGYPFVPAPDPETPNEEENRYLSVSITINPWTWYTQNEEL